MDTENPISQTFDDVLLAMDRFNHDFERRIQDLRECGYDEKELSALVRGVLAMKDSAGIYAAWARHYMEQLNKADGRISEEDLIEEA